MSTYRQRIDSLARRHLAFAVANCALNPRFAAVTVGSCGDSWELWRVAGEASNMTENALSILIVIFSVQLQQTEISQRKLFIFHLGSGSQYGNSGLSRHEIFCYLYSYRVIFKHLKIALFIEHGLLIFY